jgi:hypothetical protein
MDLPVSAPPNPVTPTPASPAPVAPLAVNSQEAQITEKKFPLKRLISIFSLLAILGLLLLGWFYWLRPKLTSEIIVSDQPAGERIFIQKLVLQKKGYLAILEENDYGKPGGAVSVSILLEPDTYENFDMPIVEFLLFSPEGIGINPGDTLYALIFQDSDGDGDFDREIDKPLRDLKGEPISVSFTLL